MDPTEVRQDPTSEPVDAVRAFNRFYTRRLGLLGAGLQGSRYSLPEVRVLYELAAAPDRSASDLARALDLDLGYVSRLVKKLHAAGLVKKTPSPVDGRQSLLALTAKGVKVLTPIEQATREQIATLLDGVPPDLRDTLLGSMRTIQRVLDPGERSDSQVCVIREPRVGDLGWIVHRQAVLYAQEFGWDRTFEGMLAEIVAKFVKDFDAACERCWVAEREGAIVGAVFVVRKTKQVAQLRMLFVEPSARGLGLGARLTAECIAFAKAKGYRSMVLWTNDILSSARKIYLAAGFVLEREERHRSFGKDLVGQYWSLRL
jgi:DNA-binding MarR family transcriptional regulator/GNAT superfamily N-acetyltransferase